MAATEPEAVDPIVAPDAPVLAFAEAEIDAPIEDVWNVLTAIDRWPTWNPDVKSVTIEGAVAEGTTFRWKAGPGTITSTVVRVDGPRLIAWSGQTLGIRAIHVWRLERRDGRTHVRTEESYDGMVASLLRRPLRKVLEKTLRDGTGSLKLESERPGSPSAGSPTARGAE